MNHKQVAVIFTWNGIHIDQAGSARQAGPVSQDFAGCVMAWYARHATSRVGGRAALVEPANGRAVVRVVGRRTLEEQLLERQFTVENVPMRRIYHALDIRWQQYLRIDDRVAEARRKLIDGVEHIACKAVPLLLPACCPSIHRGHVRQTG